MLKGLNNTEKLDIKYWRKNIKIIFTNIKKYLKDFFWNENSIFPFIIIVLMTSLLLYNNSMIVNNQKIAYESDKIANELRNSSEDLTKYVRIFVATSDPKYEREYWHVLNVRNGKEARADGRKIPLQELMKKLGFTNIELKKLRESQTNSDKLVKKEIIAMDAIKGIPDINISKLIKSNESKRAFAIRIVNDESYQNDKTTIMNPINDVIQLVDKRTQVKLMHYNILNYLYMFVAFFIVILLFARYIYLINKVKQYANSERLMRKIFETMRSSLDINKIKNTIVNEVGKALNANICALWRYDKVSNAFIMEEYSEYRSSNNIKSLVGNNSKNLKIDWLIDLYKIGQEVIFSNVKQFIKEKNLEGSFIEKYFKKYDIKANYNIPIFNSDELLGVLIVQYTKDYNTLSQEDLDFLRIIAVQAGEAIYQSGLYQELQLRAEREKINRTLIEILRSSMDKVIIKKLFVKNIGKFFNANRVFFSDYDPIKKIYLPIDENSEYLSGRDQKSFIGFDWSSPDVGELIKPLLEKREIKINNIDDYIKENLNINKELKVRHLDFDVKSSYNFPVLHQNDIMGYFCIEFTNRTFVLSEEDINRIRSICTQAGIALYHAELYLQAQQCALSKESSIQEVSEQIKKPVHEILDLSNLLSQKEFDHNAQIEYLNNIIYSCNLLLELTKTAFEN